MYVNLIVDKSSKKLDKTFSYSVPSTMINSIEVGDRVVVPFGRGDNFIEALVYEICYDEPEFKLKDITAVLDKKYSFTKTQVALLKYLRILYGSSYQKAYSTILPSVQTLDIKTSYVVLDNLFNFQIYDKVKERDLKKLLKKNQINDLIKENKLEKKLDFSLKIKEKLTEYISPNFDDIALVLQDVPAKNVKVIRILKHVHSLKKIELSELKRSANCTARDIDNLIQKKYLVKTGIEKETNLLDYDIKPTGKLSSKTFKLTDEQQEVLKKYDDLKKQSKPFRAVLNGVTGSGKTLVYIEMAKKAIERGQQVLILVPEIALTPQLIFKISASLTQKIAVLHTHISNANKAIEYKDIKSGKANVVVGARSAMFAPFKNLGLIVVDEAHETSYKSDFTPRYDSIELLMKLSEDYAIDLVIGSATSKLEHIVKAKNSSYLRLHMKKRVGVAKIPKIEIVDMVHSKMKLGDITETMYKRLDETFQKNERAIILHNRKGYSAYRQCKSCRNVEKCINCDVALTIENKKGKAVCKYCMYKIERYDSCSVCRGELFDVNPAVRSVLEDLQTLFKDRVFVAVDSLVTANTKKYKQILDDFENGKISALVGTQVIAKGLDFKDVTLACVLRADMLFNSPDFTAAEKAFSLIYQLIGRAGRHQKTGLALVQTMDVENRTLKYLSSYDYYSFISEENVIRKATGFPPYSRLYSIRFAAETDTLCFSQANRCFEFINRLFTEKNMKIMIYKPRAEYYSRIKNKYNYYLLIKNTGESHQKIVKILHNILVINKYNVVDERVNVALDFSPTTL